MALPLPLPTATTLTRVEVPRMGFAVVLKRSRKPFMPPVLEEAARLSWGSEETTRFAASANALCVAASLDVSLPALASALAICASTHCCSLSGSVMISAGISLPVVACNSSARREGGQGQGMEGGEESVRVLGDPGDGTYGDLKTRSTALVTRGTRGMRTLASEVREWRERGMKRGRSGEERVRESRAKEDGRESEREGRPAPGR